MHQKLVARSATVGVLGQGYVGLPLALEVSRAGFNTIGFDVSAEQVAQLNAGRSHITDVNDDDIGKAIAGGKYRATYDFAELGRCDVIIICVPTPLRKNERSRYFLHRFGNGQCSAAYSSACNDRVGNARRTRERRMN